MKWGVYLTTAQPPHQTQEEVFANTAAYIDAAEDLGYDAVWVLEHHFTRYGVCASPLTMAAFVLGRTKRLKAGTAISVVPLEHPIRLAEEVALLDQVSGGRFYFGVGRGGFVKDFQVFGGDMPHSLEVLSEWMDIIDEAWSTGRLQPRTGRIPLEMELEVIPSPRPGHRPPVYVVAASPTTIEWAARRGFPMLLSFMLTDETKQSQLELYAEVAEDAGHDPANVDHALSCIALASDSDAEAEALVRQHLEWWLREAVRAAELHEPRHRHLTTSYEFHHRRMEETVIGGSWDVDSVIDRALGLNPIGSPRRCADVLTATAEATGLRHFICGFEAAADRERALDSMKRFHAEVIPEVERLG